MAHIASVLSRQYDGSGGDVAGTTDSDAAAAATSTRTEATGSGGDKIEYENISWNAPTHPRRTLVVCALIARVAPMEVGVALLSAALHTILACPVPQQRQVGLLRALDVFSPVVGIPLSGTHTGTGPATSSDGAMLLAVAVYYLAALLPQHEHDLGNVLIRALGSLTYDRAAANLGQLVRCRCTSL